MGLTGMTVARMARADTITSVFDRGSTTVNASSIWWIDMAGMRQDVVKLSLAD